MKKKMNIVVWNTSGVEGSFSYKPSSDGFITELVPYDENRRPWPYKVAPNRFFKKINGHISVTKP